MEPIELLTEKVHEAAAQIVDLKKERKQLLSEVALLRKQLKDQQSLTKENDRFRKNQDQLRVKLERLNKKLGTLVRANGTLTEVL